LNDVTQRLAPFGVEEAHEMMREVKGFPVAMKLVSTDIPHKSEIGGVLLNVGDEVAVRDGFDTLMERAQTAQPDAKVDGVVVAPMISGGVETILGVKVDPAFGPVVVFGLGGIFVELLNDVTQRLAPFGVEEAHEMMREVKGFPLLDGARGAPPADVDALAEALSKLSVFAHENADSLESIDINPFLVLPKGEGAFAVDALIIPSK
jgi:acyl-CoA synthetase (NDP forming)